MNPGIGKMDNIRPSLPRGMGHVKEETNTGPEDRPVLKREPKGDWAIHSQFSFPASAVMSLLFLKKRRTRIWIRRKVSSHSLLS